MAALLPGRLLSDASRQNALLITANSQHVTLSFRYRGHEAPLGQFRIGSDTIVDAVASLHRRPHCVIVRVGPDALLERPVELPLAAERDLDRVISYEMDRLTPFSAADVVWRAAVTKRDLAQRRLLLRLSLVPRSALQPCLDLLAHVGLQPAWVEASAADGTPCRIAMSASHGNHTTHRVLAIVGGVLVALGVAVIVTPFVTQALARAETERQIAALEPKVARVAVLRQHIAADAAGALPAERSRIGDGLRILAAVTDIVPDGSWLTELTLHDGKLGISGQSPAAARLIVALSADPAFRNPSFAAPVTRATDGRADLFVIHAEVAP
jgi:general secretion pathway protein L